MATATIPITAISASRTEKSLCPLYGPSIVRYGSVVLSVREKISVVWLLSNICYLSVGRFGI
jgi:hypothetical protein